MTAPCCGWSRPGVDPDSVTVLVSQDAYAIFAGMCILTLFCVFVWLFVWLKKL